MKGDVFKKVGAVVTTMAMLASIGFTAFAEEIEDGSANGFDSTNRVTADISVENPAMTGKAGIYKVSVAYTANEGNQIGVTMLAYADTDDGKFESTDIPSGYTETGMQIVGIKQSDEASAEGTFDFYVNTNTNTSDGDMIRMDVGGVGIVLVSSDAAEAPTGYLFELKDGSFDIEKVDISEEAITVPYGTSFADVKARLEDLTITVSGEGGSEDNWSAAWAIESYDATKPDTYTAVGTLKKPSNSNGNLGDQKTVEVEVTVDELKWDAVSGTMDDVNVIVSADSEVEAALAAAVVGKVITLTDANGEYTAAVEVNETIAATLALGEGNNYTLTVAQGTEVDDPAVTVPEAFVVSFTANVAYIADEEFEADPTETKIVDGDGKEISINTEYDNDATLDEILADVKTALANATADVYGEDENGKTVVEQGYTLDLENAKISDEPDQDGYYEITIPLAFDKTPLANSGAGVASMTIKVKKKTGVEYIVGDANGSGAITPGDWAAVINFLNRKYTDGLPEGATPETNINAAAADTSGDKRITPGDWAAIINYLNRKPGTQVGETRVFQ